MVEGSRDYHCYGGVGYNGCMFKRFVVSLLLALIPTVSYAAVADTLGPSATGGGGSNADAAALQPAGGSALPNLGGASSNGLTAPTSDALQAPALSDEQLRVFMAGETDGERQTNEADAETPVWLWLVAAGLVLVAAGAWFMHWRRRRSTIVAVPAVAEAADVVPEIVSEPAPEAEVTTPKTAKRKKPKRRKRR